MGSFGRDRITGEDQLGRDVAGECHRETEEATGGGDERTLHLGHPETSVGRRDDQITRQDDLGAAGQRRAVDGGDQRLGANPLDESGEPALLGAHLSSGAARDGLEIGARTEHRAGTGDDADPDVVVRFDVVDGGFDPLRNVAVDRVAGLGSVDGDEADVVGNRVVDHGSRP